MIMQIAISQKLLKMNPPIVAIRLRTIPNTPAARLNKQYNNTIPIILPTNANITYHPFIN